MSATVCDWPDHKWRAGTKCLAVCVNCGYCINADPDVAAYDAVEEIIKASGWTAITPGPFDRLEGGT